MHNLTRLQDSSYYRQLTCLSKTSGRHLADPLFHISSCQTVLMILIYAASCFPYYRVVSSFPKKWLIFVPNLFKIDKLMLNVQLLRHMSFKGGIICFFREHLAHRALQMSIVFLY